MQEISPEILSTIQKWDFVSRVWLCQTAKLNSNSDAALNTADFNILCAVANGYCFQKDIAGLLNLKSATVCQHTFRLLKKNYLIQQPESDRRRRKLLLTDAGREILSCRAQELCLKFQSYFRKFQPKNIECFDNFLKEFQRHSNNS